jgi:internalin A
LPWLRFLNLSHNGLSTLPESITRLQNLTSLNLRDNVLRTLPEWMTQLQNLTSLDLSGNALNPLPESITQLQSLISLDLSHNGLSAPPESITQLQNLTSLNLRDNGLRMLPEWITQLQNLTSLDLSHNGLSGLPESFGQLQNLTSLDLSHNGLSALPYLIGQLQNLTQLDLRDNGLRKLPESMAQLQNLTKLALDGNALISPPEEIARKGIKAIREYLRQLDQEGVDHLYEAKLLILGEGGAGKTTFARKILDNSYVLRDEESTKGVDVLRWSFPIEGGTQFRVNIWDFGGQEIYHATHQFFLTRRSLYALVVDTRKDDTDFYYWLNVAELLSDSSPLLIIKNEIQDRHREINERQLKGQFGGLKEVLATNLATNRDLEKVREAVKYHIKTLPHIGSPLPKTWVRVRERLEKDSRNYITFDEYLSICKNNGFTQAKDSLQLSGYLHDIGVFLHFQEEPLLRKTVILKPTWGTDAVYKVLDNQMVIRNLGHFTRADLETIWEDPEYETMRDELLQLMMKFKLCYEIPTQKGTYIAPQLLTEDQPDYQ